MEGCSCHINPPCPFCESLTEEEVNLVDSGATFDEIIRRRENAEDEDVDEDEESWRDRPPML